MSLFIATISLLGTIAIFYICKMFYKKYKKEWLSPMLMTPLVIIGILLLTGIPYKTYNTGANVLTNLLGPATVAFAIPIYKNVNLLKNTHSKFSSVLRLALQLLSYHPLSWL